MITIVHVEPNISVSFGIGLVKVIVNPEPALVKVIVNPGLPPTNQQIMDAFSDLPDYLNDDNALGNGLIAGDIYFLGQGTDVGTPGTLKKILV